MKKVVVGGTFDLLHRGHREFLTKASSLGELKIGLTSDEMAKRTKGVEVEKYEEREKNLLELFPKAKIEKIDDPVGFALYEDFDFIVVSLETRSRAEKINSKRKDNGKNEMEIVEVDFVLATDGNPVSSSRIRKNEIDKEGKLI